MIGDNTTYVITLLAEYFGYEFFKNPDSKPLFKIEQTYRTGNFYIPSGSSISYGTPVTAKDVTIKTTCNTNFFEMESDYVKKKTPKEIFKYRPKDTGIKYNGNKGRYKNWKKH